MNVGLRRKVSMLAMLVGVFASLATLQASDAAVAKKKSKVAAAQSNHKKLSPFEDAQKRLKAQVKKVKDPKAQKLLQNVIKNADQVQKAGVKVTPGAVAKALVSIQEVTNYLSNQKIGAKHSSSTSSSSKSCNECNLLHEIRKEIEECCQNLASELEEIENFLETQFPCNAPIAIDHVPFVISQSGKYCVTTDLVYTGSGTAIAVTVDNVTINFADHNLTLTVDGAQGIHAENVSEFVLEDDRIQGTSLFTSPTSVAVNLVNVNKATLKNIYTLNTTNGIQITGCTDVTVKNSLLRFHSGHGVFIDGSTGVTVDSSTLAGADIPASSPATSDGFFTQNNTQNVSLINSTFTGWAVAINAHQVTGLLIDHCLAIASDVTNGSVLQLGFGNRTTQANDVTIRNSNFMQPVLFPGCDGLLLLNGTGCVLENVIVDTTTTTDNTGYIPAAIHIGCAANGGCDPTTSYNNVLATNCIVRGANQYGLYIESGFKVTFDHSQFTDASLANIWMQGATNSIIKDSSVTNGTGSATGILIDDGSNNNAVINCDVSTNGGDGIAINTGALFNHLRGNSVFDNAGTGIDNDGTDTETFFNTSCHNGIDCEGVFPEQFAGDSPALAGSNVCCDLVE